MKKLLFFLGFVLCGFAVNGQLMTDSYYSNVSNSDEIIFKDSKVYWNISPCYDSSLSELYLTLNFNTDNIYSLADQFPDVTLNQPTPHTVVISVDPTSLGILNNRQFDILNSSDEIVATVVLKCNNEIIEISLDTTNIVVKNDTLIICSKFENSSLSFNFKIRNNGTILKYFDLCGTTLFNIYLNNKFVKSGTNINFSNYKFWGSMNLITGDTLSIGFANPMYYCDQTTSYYNCKLPKTKSYIIKLVENEATSVNPLFLKGDLLICPGDTTWIGSDNDITDGCFWVKNMAETLKYDTLSVTQPSTYRLVKNTIKGKCASVSTEIKVKKGINCQGLIKGYVFDKNSYNNNTGKYNPFEGVKVKTNNGLVTISDKNGYYEFRYDSIFISEVNQLKIVGSKFFNQIQSIYVDKKFMLVNFDFLTFLLETKDLSSHLNSSRNRPGFTMPYYVSIENKGKNPLTTNVSVTLDGNLTYTSQTEENKPTKASGQTLTWENITVESGATKRLTFYATLDRTTPLGTELVSSAELIMATPDDVPENDKTTFKTIVSGSFDPNDKLVTYAGAFTEGYVYDTTSFEYTIRFQNTGTDTAFTVRVEDVISKNLDLTTINFIDASHEFTPSISGDTVKWTFNNILLPDSNVNEPASHGFIRFSINQKIGNLPGTEIRNKAAIYFDFNDPVITNEIVSIVDNDIVTELENELNYQTQGIISTYPNPARTSISINAEGTGTFELYNAIGSRVLQTSSKENINIEILKSGVYYYQFITNSETFSGSFVKE